MRGVRQDSAAVEEGISLACMEHGLMERWGACADVRGDRGVNPHLQVPGRVPASPCLPGR